MSRYNINYIRLKRHVADPFKFVLMNGDQIAGPRLVRNSETFPLPNNKAISDSPHDCRWNRFKTEAEAISAVAKLQKYLDDHDSKKRTKKP